MTDDDLALLDLLADALDDVGITQALEAPLITYNRRCFPEAWQPTLLGVRTALRRMLVHVGMRDVPIEVSDARQALASDGLVFAPVEFEGIRNRAAVFEVRAVARPDIMAPWLALEAASAWAAYHGVTGAKATRSRAKPNVEEADWGSFDDANATTLAIALGFGPVVASGAIQTCKKESVSIRWITTDVETQTVGGVPPVALVRLLACYGLARAAEAEELDQVRSALSPDMRREYDAMLDGQSSNVRTIRERLGVPGQPPTVRRRLDQRPLPDAEEADLAGAEQDLERRVGARNEGRPVFRVLCRSADIGAAYGAVLGFVATVASAFLGGPTPFAFLLPILGGAWVGHTRVYFVCSGLECGRRLSEDATTCPGCAGRVAGVIASATERLEAEERLEALEASKL